MADTDKTDKNIVITGFMGTGKTAVGQMVAKLLNRDFIDTDHTIEKRAGKSIPLIFTQSGEAHFRRMENELIEELASKNRMVISTGGGTFLNNDNYRLLDKSSIIFCLSARPDIIYKRLAEVNDRPLLGQSPSVERIKEILEERKGDYGRLPNHIDTSDITIKDAAKNIIDLFGRMTD